MSPSTPRWGHAWNYCSVFLDGLVIALFAWLVSGSNAYAQAGASQRVIVRSYNTIGLPLSMVDRAESTVGELLHEAGIDSSWRNCRTNNGPSSESDDVCGDVLNPSEVIVRIVRAPVREIGARTGEHWRARRMPRHLAARQR